MIVDVVMPQMGESIAEGTVAKWIKNIGEWVEKDETILEITTDKVDAEIPSPASGILSKIIAKEGETVHVGVVIAKIETDKDAVRTTDSSESTVEPVVQETTAKVEITATKAVATDTGGDGSARREAKIIELDTNMAGRTGRVGRGGRFYSPLVRNIASTEGVAIEELETLTGSGSNGRVTKKDILAFLSQRTVTPGLVQQVGQEPKSFPRESVEVIPMDTMRKSIAEHMLRSVQTSPHVASVVEVDMTGIVIFREKNKKEFERKEGFKLTYLPFIISAVIDALKAFPWINASVDGDKIVVKKFINIGIAVALDTEQHGLIVPVIKNADGRNFVGLARAANDLATRARSKRLVPDDVQDGTFTITNPGLFGGLFGIPIINQPQVAILGIGAIKKRPVVINDAIAIRSMMYLSMSYDHRIVDGAQAEQFLQRVVNNLENFDSSVSI